MAAGVIAALAPTLLNPGTIRNVGSVADDILQTILPGKIKEGYNTIKEIVRPIYNTLTGDTNAKDKDNPATNLKNYLLKDDLQGKAISPAEQMYGEDKMDHPAKAQSMVHKAWLSPSETDITKSLPTYVTPGIHNGTSGPKLSMPSSVLLQTQDLGQSAGTPFMFNNPAPRAMYSKPVRPSLPYATVVTQEYANQERSQPVKKVAQRAKTKPSPKKKAPVLRSKGGGNSTFTK